MSNFKAAKKIQIHFCLRNNANKYHNDCQLLSLQKVPAKSTAGKNTIFQIFDPISVIYFYLRIIQIILLL